MLFRSPQDYDLALSWYERAADQKFAKAFYKIGYFYENGLGVGKDVTKAFTFYEKAANLGYIKAEVEVGKAYASGRGLLRDVEKAKIYLGRAAEKGDRIAARLLRELE